MIHSLWITLTLITSTLPPQIHASPTAQLVLNNINSCNNLQINLPERSMICSCKDEITEINTPSTTTITTIYYCPNDTYKCISDTTNQSQYHCQNIINTTDIIPTTTETIIQVQENATTKSKRDDSGDASHDYPPYVYTLPVSGLALLLAFGLNYYDFAKFGGEEMLQYSVPLGLEFLQ
ncbi:hypothetical protein HDU76_000141 [Blyttiomyces sp. JEL0837]|nr:hypothetical protein HDU76_000141 [Blyttiomyces sp. JEL0837]